MTRGKKTEEDNELKVQGCCNFCGQTFLMPDTAGGMTEDEKNEAATIKCSCSEAKSYVRKKERKKKINDYVDETFSARIQETIKDVIENIDGDGDIVQAAFKTRDGWNTKIYLDKDSYINIKRKATKTGKELKA